MYTCLEWKKQSLNIVCSNCVSCFMITRCLVLLYSYQASLQHNDSAPNLHDEGAENKDAQKLRPCRVILENAIDYHHEVIESVVRRFPLPWHTFNCTTSKPIIIYDFALFQIGFPIEYYLPLVRSPSISIKQSFGGGSNTLNILSSTQLSIVWKMFMLVQLHWRVGESTCYQYSKK